MPGIVPAVGNQGGIRSFHCFLYDGVTEGHGRAWQRRWYRSSHVAAPTFTTRLLREHELWTKSPVEGRSKFIMANMTVDAPLIFLVRAASIIEAVLPTFRILANCQRVLLDLQSFEGLLLLGLAFDAKV